MKKNIALLCFLLSVPLLVWAQAKPMGAGIYYTCRSSAPTPAGTVRSWTRCSDGHRIDTDVSNVDHDVSISVFVSPSPATLTGQIPAYSAPGGVFYLQQPGADGQCLKANSMKPTGLSYGGGACATGQLSVPTYVVGPGAGTGPTTFAIVGTDTAMLVKLTTGSATPTGATVLTITLTGSTFSSTPHCHIQPANAAAEVLLTAYVDQASDNATTVVVKSGITALQATTPFLWEVFCQ